MLTRSDNMGNSNGFVRHGGGSNLRRFEIEEDITRIRNCDISAGDERFKQV